MDRDHIEEVKEMMITEKKRAEERLIKIRNETKLEINDG